MIFLQLIEYQTLRLGKAKFRWLLLRSNEKTKLFWKRMKRDLYVKG